MKLCLHPQGSRRPRALSPARRPRHGRCNSRSSFFGEQSSHAKSCNTRSLAGRIVLDEPCCDTATGTGANKSHRDDSAPKNCWRSAFAADAEDFRPEILAPNNPPRRESASEEAGSLRRRSPGRTAPQGRRTTRRATSRPAAIGRASRQKAGAMGENAQIHHGRKPAAIKGSPCGSFAMRWVRRSQPKTVSPPSKTTTFRA